MCNHHRFVFVGFIVKGLTFDLRAAEGHGASPVCEEVRMMFEAGGAPAQREAAGRKLVSEQFETVGSRYQNQNQGPLVVSETAREPVQRLPPHLDGGD